MIILCPSCNGKLILSTVCSSCKGSGGWGDLTRKGHDSCLTCDGTGKPQNKKQSVKMMICEKCKAIYPPSKKECECGECDECIQKHIDFYEKLEQK